MTNSIRCWLSSYSGWIAVGFLAFGSFGIGYGIAILQGRADAVVRVQNVSAGYKAALEAKDKIISQLAGSAVRATTQAANAVDTATAAADAATQAADSATKAADNSKAMRDAK